MQRQLLLARVVLFASTRELGRLTADVEKLELQAVQVGYWNQQPSLSTVSKQTDSL
jgi:hypothetical protein